jgi:hypothetical protein
MSNSPDLYTQSAAPKKIITTENILFGEEKPSEQHERFSKTLPEGIDVEAWISNIEHNGLE